MPLYQKAIPLSPARARLKSMIEARADAVERMKLLQGAISRLAGAQTAVSPAIAALASLESSEAAAMSAWSRSTGSEPAPVVDADQHAALSKQIADAAAQKRGAQIAEAAAVAEYNHEAGNIQRISLAIEDTACEIVADEAEALLPAFIEANTKLAAMERQLIDAREIIVSAAHARPQGESARHVYVRLEEFSNALGRALPKQGQDVIAGRASRQAWFSLIENLKSDATATLN